MGYPQSITRPQPGIPMPRPANDNVPRPRPPMQPPRPANDNFPGSRGRGRRRLPNLGRLLRRGGHVGLALSYLTTLYMYYNHEKPIPGQWTIPGGWELLYECGRPRDFFTFYGYLCGPTVRHIPHDEIGRIENELGNNWSFGFFEHVGELSESSQGLSAAVYQRTGPTTGANPEPAVETRTAVLTHSSVAMPAAPYPGFYPPLLNPATAAPPLRYGFAGERKTALFPEDSESGYGTAPTPVSDHILSRRPPRGTKEQKFRAKTVAAGRIVERIVSGSTEGLDYAWAIFNSLPTYLRYMAFNHYRRIEVRGNDGFIKEARLHYVALTPQQMLEWVHQHLEHMDPQKLLTNILQMQGEDRMWAAIGKAMGQYARGPWDQPLPNGVNASDWEPYMDWITEEIYHNEALLDDIARQYGLTREEMKIIQNRLRLYEQQNPGYEPPINL